MKKLKIAEVKNYVKNNIGDFHERRISNLNGLQLNKILKKKNPYLFKAKNVMRSDQIIKAILDAHLSSQEEGIFGDWLEGLAIFINSRVFNGIKSGIPGIDLEFNNDKIRYIVTIKSGPNWGNASQIQKLIIDFNKAKKTLKTSNSKLQVIAVNGCCYGKLKNTLQPGEYYKYCGQQFWEFISNDPELYLKIIEPLGHLAKEKNSEFKDSYDRTINKFTLEFSKSFCNKRGEIEWEQLLKYNSEK
jgi:hypothetical protein